MKRFSGSFPVVAAAVSVAVVGQPLLAQIPSQQSVARVVPSQGLQYSYADAWGISADEWPRLECWEILTRADFANNYAAIITAARAGDESAQIIMMSYVNCPRENRFAFAGWDESFLDNQSQTRPMLGGMPGPLVRLRQECLADKNICSVYRTQGPIGQLALGIETAIRREYGNSDEQGRSSASSPEDLLWVSGVRSLVRQMGRSRNPRAWFAAGDRDNGSMTDNFMRAAQAGVVPAQVDLALAFDSYKDFGPFNQAYGVREYYAVERWAGQQLVRLAPSSGRAAISALRFVTDPEQVRQLWRQAVTYGWHPGGGPLIRAVQAGDNGLRIAPEEAIAWLDKAERMSGVPSSERERLAEPLQREIARRAERGPFSEVATRAPSLANVTAVFIREMRAANDQTNYYFQVLDAFGARPSTVWDEYDGSVSISSNGQGFGYYAQWIRVNISNLACTRVAAARVPSFDCTFNVGGSISMQWANLQFGASTPGSTRKRYRFEWDGSHWTAPSIRGDMISGLRPATAGANPSQNSHDNLCRALGAGVIAAGGSSTSTALSPNSWMC
jgi:hypothetical protein